MLIPERLSNGCTNLRTLEAKPLPQSAHYQGEAPSESLESERNHHTLPLQMMRDHHRHQ